jgi:hypothetical protein
LRAAAVHTVTAATLRAIDGPAGRFSIALTPGRYSLAKELTTDDLDRASSAAGPNSLLIYSRLDCTFILAENFHSYSQIASKFTEHGKFFTH